jgi:hypothetical protein
LKPGDVAQSRFDILSPFRRFTAELPINVEAHRPGSNPADPKKGEPVAPSF